MNVCKPVWLDDCPIIKKLLLSFIKRHSNGVNRPSFAITEKKMPELFDFNNIDTDFLWSLITLLQSDYGVIEIRTKKAMVNEPLYINAKLYFMAETLPIIKEWLSEELKPKPVKEVNFYDSNEWKRFRFKAFELHGNICQCCGLRPPEVVLEVDHVKPRSKYPELQLSLDNLQILCRDCNGGKSNRSNTDFRTDN